MYGSLSSAGRWSAHLSDTATLLRLPQSSVTLGGSRLPHRLRVLQTLVVWWRVCTGPGVFTAACWSAITSVRLLVGELRLQSELDYLRDCSLPSPGLRLVGRSHCSTCVAQFIRGMMVDVIPTFLQFNTSNLARVPNWMMATIPIGVCARWDLTQHLTAWADSNHAPPVTSVSKKLYLEQSEGCQDLLQVLRVTSNYYMLHRLCRYNSFEFQPCSHSPGGCLIR